jgi:hypothetical protein
MAKPSWLLVSAAEVRENRMGPSTREADLAVCDDPLRSFATFPLSGLTGWFGLTDIMRRCKHH